MRSISLKLSLLALMFCLALGSGCGGGGGGGGAAPPTTGGAPLPVNIGNRQASLTIEGVPEGARIYVDGQPQTLGTTTLSLLPGTHEIVLTRAGYTHQNRAEFKNISLQAGETLKKTAVFSRIKPPKLVLPNI